VLGRARRAFENAQCSLYRTATRRRPSTSEIERARDDRRERRRRRRRRSFPRRFFARRKRSVRRRRALRLRRLRAVPLGSLGREPSEDEHAVRFVCLLQRALSVCGREYRKAKYIPIGTRPVKPRFTNTNIERRSMDARRIESSGIATKDAAQSWNACTEWVKYKCMHDGGCFH